MITEGGGLLFHKKFAYLLLVQVIHADFTHKNTNLMIVKIEESWAEALQEEFSKEYFERLVQFVRSEYSTAVCYPPGPEIFNAFNLCPLNKVKVVIIGQDPYHNYGQAEGLCFSVKTGIELPPSLVNIFKEIKDDIGVVPPDNTLTSLNTSSPLNNILPKKPLTS